MARHAKEPALWRVLLRIGRLIRMWLLYFFNSLLVETDDASESSGPMICETFFDMTSLFISGTESLLVSDEGDA